MSATTGCEGDVVDDRSWVWDEATDWSDELVLIVLPQAEYEYWVRRLDVRSCSTWGEVRALGDDVYAEVLGLAGYGTFEEYSQHLAIQGEAPLIGAEQTAREQWLASDHDLPDLDDDFDVNSLGAFADGDWPPSVNYLMHALLPDELVRNHGSTYMTVLNGVQATLMVDHRDAVLAEMASRGYTMVREPGLGRFVEPF